MVVPLGIGVGDVIAVGKLVKRIVSELKNAGDAASEYQAVQDELEALADTLDEITKFEAGHFNIERLDRIKAAANACEAPLQKFLDKISKFEVSLGESSTRGKAKSAARRVQWAAAYSEDVMQLRATLGAHVALLMLLLDLQLLDSGLAANAQRAKMARQIDDIQNRLEEIINHPAVSPLIDGTSQDAWDAAFAAFDTKIEKTLGQSSGVAASLDQQVDALRKVELEIASLRSPGTPVDTQTTKLLSSTSANDPDSADSVSSLASTLNLLTVALAISSSTNAYYAFKAAPQLSRRLQPRAREHTQSLNGSSGAAEAVTAYTNMAHASSRSTDGSQSQRLKVSPQPVPPYLSFLVKIDTLVIDYTKTLYAQRETSLPPAEGDVFKGSEDPALFLRWAAGRCSSVSISMDNEMCGIGLEEYYYSTASVFTRNPVSSNLLVMPMNVKRRIRPASGSIWQDISFDHIKIKHSRALYSSVSSVGDEQRIAAPAPPHWENQLISPFSNYKDHRAGDAQQKRQAGLQAGLIGELPLLFALAAFSAPSEMTTQVLTTCIQPGAWRKHPYKFPAGHDENRGMVVTIFLDPQNPTWSTRKHLDKLQNGGYGPFYGRLPFTES